MSSEIVSSHRSTIFLLVTYNSLHRQVVTEVMEIVVGADLGEFDSTFSNCAFLKSGGFKKCGKTMLLKKVEYLVKIVKKCFLKKLKV